MWTRLRIAGFVFAGALLIVAPARAQQVSRCASCHFANIEFVPAASMLGDWAQSPHGRHGIGCERCHGGDPSSEHPVEAHRGVLGPANALSPINAANLVSTCAQCHRANADAFGESVHQTLLVTGDRRAPTCATCHSAMRARTISTTALETRCAGCHAPTSGRGEYAAAMRSGVDALHTLRARCDRLDLAAGRVRDKQDQITVQLAIAAARYTLGEGIAAVHGFDAAKVHERGDAVRVQLDAVAEALANAR